MPVLNTTTDSRMDMMGAMHNTENNSFTILAVTGSWCFLAVFIVLTRLYTRIFMVRYIGWDDITIVITMLLGVCVWICFVGESHSALGKHWQAITPRELEAYSKWQFAHSMLSLWATQGVRIAYMLFIIRLSPRKLFRNTLFSVVGFMTLYTFANWLTILLACTHISANWERSSSRCISLSAYTGLGLSNTILGMITNATLALIPLPIILSLNLTLRAKICTSVAFGLGMVTVACTAVKAYHQFHFIGEKDRLYQDQFFVWAALELYIGIITASLISLRPLIGTLIDKIKSTIVTTAMMAKSAHVRSQNVQSLKISSPILQSPGMHSPRFDEKVFEQPKKSPGLLCPQIQVLPSTPHIGFVDSSQTDSAWTKPPKSPTVDDDKESSWTKLPKSPKLFTTPTFKQKHRPAPLNLSALKRRASSLEISCMGGVLISPTPTHLPAGLNLDFLDLVPARNPEILQQQQFQFQGPKQQKPFAILPPPSLTPNNILNRRLSIPSISGLLASPSPTWLPSDSSEDLDFFSLCKGRSESIIGSSTSSTRPTSIDDRSQPSSRRATMISVPEDASVDHSSYFYYPQSRRSTHWSQTNEFVHASTATAQPLKRYNSSEIKRRPSMAPSQKSAGSAFLSPMTMPESGLFGPDGRLFFHVMSSGQFRETAQKAAADVVVNPSGRRISEDMPLSPFSMDPRTMQQQQQMNGNQVRRRVSVDVGPKGEALNVTSYNGKERVDSSNTFREKDE